MAFVLTIRAPECMILSHILLWPTVCL